MTVTDCGRRFLRGLVLAREASLTFASPRRVQPVYACRMCGYEAARDGSGPLDDMGWPRRRRLSWRTA